MAQFQDLIFHSLSVKELSIVSNCCAEYASLLDQSSYANITLPNLTTLKIINSIYEWEQEQASLSSHDINYSTQLSLILAGSTSLKRIEVCYNDDKALKTLLHVFGAVPALSSLSSIVIRGQGKLPALCASNLTSIGQIPVPKLKTLHFVCCIKSEGDGTEVKAAFEIMLKRFPKLHVLKIDGCFMMSATNTSTLPKIVLDFPKLDHLTFLELGASCKYLSNFETDKKQPHKKKKKIAINLRPGQPQVNEVGPAGEDVPLLNLMGDESNVHFPISITFPGLMPRLEFVSIGALYVFQTLYLSELPVLKVFRVASAWAQSYPNYFPPATGRKGIREGQPQICNVEELKLPDSFKDCSIIKKIIPHFPHLTNVHLSLPSVKFVRAFAKTMATTGPDCFQKFSMRTQFDFASSLDSCILDNIVKPNEAELEQIRILKAYPHFQNYVKENQIELPYEHPEEEDPDKFCGLRILFKKLKWIRILHLPRTLRLPQGLRHWIDDPQPEFTNTIIGFKKYPFSKAVEIECPPTMKLFTSRLDVRRFTNLTSFTLMAAVVYLLFLIFRCPKLQMASIMGPVVTRLIG